MNGTDDKPIPYRVVYSERVRTELKSLIDRAKDAGYGIGVLDALKEMDLRLHIYPQYGEQLRELSMTGVSQWNATFPPLYVDYAIDEPNRAVYVVAPLKIMPYTDFK